MGKLADLARELLLLVHERKAQGFTGLGLIFYRSAVDLPVAPLGDQSIFKPKLPIVGKHEIAKVLADISCLASPWHDGFHLIDVNTVSLTHICQFVAPPSALLTLDASDQLPMGARHFAALATSRVPSVACAALLSGGGQLDVFVGGEKQSWPAE